MANEIFIQFTFDYGGFIKEFSRRLSLGSAERFDEVLDEMQTEFKKYVIAFTDERDEWADELE